MSSGNLGARFFLGSSLCVLVCSLGCSKHEPTTPAQPAASTAAPASQPAASAPSVPVATAPSAAALTPVNVIASAQYSGNPNLRCDLLEVKRASGGALLIRWRLVNTTSAQPGGGLVANSAANSIRYHDWSWSELYYTDPAENKKYAFLTDSEGNRVLDTFDGDLPIGEQRLNWAKFPAPPPTSAKITVYIPKFMPFEDVPVGQ